MVVLRESLRGKTLPQTWGVSEADSQIPLVSPSGSRSSTGPRGRMSRNPSISGIAVMVCWFMLLIGVVA